MSDSESSRSSRSGAAGEFVFVKQSTFLTPNQKEIFDKVRLLVPDDLKITDLNETECLKIKQKPQNTVFVLSVFDGKVFDHFKKLLCCIIGPPLLMSCIENAQALPKSRTPIYSDHLKNVVVCCTNVDREKRDDIYELVERMGGKFKRDLEEKCNFLIAGAVGSQKYEMASQRNIPIVTVEWALVTWRLAVSSERFDPKSEEFWSKYRCPPFVGLNITISGLRAEERKRAEKAILENGGTYSGDMKMGETSHLISTTTQGAKYDAACKWNVKIVNYQWLNDCVTRGICLNETSYRVGGNALAPPTTTDGQKSSTPTGSGAAVPRFSLLDPNCSIIPRKDQNCTEISSVVSPLAAGAPYCVNETVERSTANHESTFLIPKNIYSNDKKVSSDKRKVSSDDRKVSSSEERQASSLKKTSSSSSINESTLQSDVSKTLPSSSSKTSTALHEELTPLEDLDLTITTTGDFLRSCRIYLNGFELKQMEKLKKIVNAGGGERTPTLNDGVTHVVLTGIVDNFVKDRLNSMKTKPAIVTAQWLVRCFKLGKILSVKEFSHPDFASFVDDFSPIPVKKFRRMNLNEENQPEPIEPIDILDDLMLSQYVENPEATVSDASTKDADVLMNDVEGDTNDLVAAMNDVEGDTKDLVAAMNDVETPLNSSSSTGRNKKNDMRLSAKILNPLEVVKSETKRKNSLDKSFGDVEFDTPSKFTDPNKTFRPNFDLDEGFKYIKGIQAGKRHKLESPTVVLERNLAIAVESTSQAETWLLSPVVTRKMLSLATVDDSAMSFNSKKSSLSRVNLGKQLDNVLSRSKTSNSIIAEDEGCGGHAAGNQSPVGSSSEVSSTSVKENRLTSGGNSDSQGFKIEWEDPNQKQQKAKIQPLLKPNSEPTQNLMGDHGGGVMSDDDMNDVVEILTKKPDLYRFMLTSADEWKQMCIETIRSLNGHYLEGRTYSPECTHLIVGKPTRNEKLLACIATGKWILHPSYLIECKKAKRFVREEDYEWGGEGTSKYIAELPAMGQSLAKCCKRWRVRSDETKIKPYDGWKVVLFVDRNIENGLRSLLEHGGATLCKRDTTPPAKITHAFIADKGYERPKAAEINRFKSFKIKCLKPEYLAAYLINDPVNEREFIIN